MAARCEDNSGTTVEISMAEIGQTFPGARVVYSYGAIRMDTKPGVVIWDAAGTMGTQKVVRINGTCPNLDGGQCKLAEACFIKKLEQAKVTG